jgi:hypothetical protein
MPAAQTTKIKGNPAHHRMSNPRNKTYRLSLRVKQNARKEERRVAENARAAANRLSGTSPWEEARKARSVRRSAA